MREDNYCSRCGASLTEAQTYPKKCNRCGRISYRNPLPVAVLIVPVAEGVLLVRRAVKEAYGELALPGGYVDYGETWQQAAVRELHEETTIVRQPETVRHLWTSSNPAGSYILIFGVVPGVAALPPFQPNAETLALEVRYRPLSLAFPLHTAALQLYFDIYD